MEIRKPAQLDIATDPKAELSEELLAKLRFEAPVLRTKALDVLHRMPAYTKAVVNAWENRTRDGDSARIVTVGHYGRKLLVEVNNGYKIIGGKRSTPYKKLSIGIQSSPNPDEIGESVTINTPKDSKKPTHDRHSPLEHSLTADPAQLVGNIDAFLKRIAAPAI
ncbi:MAG TPA: hypothetical protein VM077_05195 [Candidatus Limnocylindrales bacterium]|nr:hypothetical protein [Candidatus Limnocylindrales bacterium]